MLTIVDYKELTNSEGDSFLALVLQGEVDFVQSQTSGRFYATARRVSMPCTFNEATCERLVGTEVPGQIIKVECAPYMYTSPDTREEIELSHRWEYQSATLSSAQQINPDSTLRLVA